MLNTFWVERWRWNGVAWVRDWRGIEYAEGQLPTWDFYVWPGSSLAKHVWVLKAPGWQDLGWQYNF